MKKEIKIGVFTILMILGGWFGIRFLSGIDVLSRNQDYYVVYDQTNGVEKASAVVVNGLQIGKVTDIKLSEDRHNVIIKLTIPSKYQIPVDSEAKSFSSNLMSSKVIGITLGNSNNFLDSGDTINATYDKGIMDMATTELEFLKERIDLVTEELANTLSSLNTLLEGNTATVNSTLKNIEALTDQTSKIVEHNNEQINQIIEGFSLMAQAVGNSAPKIDSIIGDFNQLTSELSQANVGSTIAESLEELKTLMAALNDEGGSINQLMTDEALYDNLVSASSSLDSLFVDINTNPGRYLKYINFSVIGRNAEKQEEKIRKKEEKELRKAKKK